MNWWRRFRSRRLPIYDEHPLADLKDASDDEKEEWHRQRLERMKSDLDPAMLADVEAATDEQNEAALADEIRKMKRRNPGEWELLLASLPEENQEQLREIERRYKIR